jgi:hypothetical protein
MTLVNGESDCLVLWFEGFMAAGLPGAASWDEERDARSFERFAKINIVLPSGPTQPLIG